MKRIIFLLAELICCALIVSGQEFKAKYNDENEKWGYVDNAGNWVIAPQFTFAFDFVKGLGEINLNTKYGLIDGNGKLITACKWDDIFIHNDGFTSVKLYEKWGFIDKTGKEVIPCLYDFNSLRNQWGYFNVEKDGRKGLCDKTGKEIVPCRYDNVYFYPDEHGFVNVDLNGKKGLCDTNGKEIFECVYDDEPNYFEGHYNVLKNGKKGVCDTIGKEIIPCKFKYVNSDDNGFIVTKEENGIEKKGVYNKSGVEIIPCQYTSLYFNKNYNAYLVESESNGIKLKGAYSKTGETIAACIYTALLFYEDRQIYVAQKDGKGDGSNDGGKWGILDVNGKEVVPVKYANNLISFGQQEYCPVNTGGISIKYKTRGGKWGLINKTGKEIISCIYDGIMSVSEELVAVNVGGSYNEEGKCVGGKWGYVNTKGDVVIPFEYEEANAFQNGVTRVKKDGQLTLLQNPLKSGNKIASNTSSKPIDPNAPAVSSYPAPNSDVDKEIPEIKTNENSTTFAFIISNENYPDAKVPYALNDGRMFKEYCQKTLGLPEKHIKVYEDATFGKIINAVDQIKAIADAFDGNVHSIIYYAGHGVPDEKKSTAYLLPIDGSSSDIATTGYSLEKLYSELGSLKCKSVTVFLDACFSGSKREGDMLASARGVAIKTKNEEPKGNLIVFAAATGDETAHQYSEKGHGLFTYFLLKQLLNSKGSSTLGELFDYISTQVKRQSVVVNNKRQTPTVSYSAQIGDAWRTISLK